jgi:hypothetical protein
VQLCANSKKKLVFGAIYQKSNLVVCHGQDNSRFAMIKRGHNPVSILTGEGKTVH